MAIEKWRPAKAGDSGLVRCRVSKDEEWIYLSISNIKLDSGGCLCLGSWHLPNCEVLEAYMSDEEVERLAKSMTGVLCQYTIKDREKWDRLAVDTIRQHFASEKGGE